MAFYALKNKVILKAPSLTVPCIVKILVDFFIEINHKTLIFALLNPPNILSK